MKDFLNEYLFYIIQSIVIVIIAIYLSYEFHQGNILLFLIYSSSMSVLVTIITNQIDHLHKKIENKKSLDESND